MPATQGDFAPHNPFAEGIGNIHYTKIHPHDMSWPTPLVDLPTGRRRSENSPAARGLPR